MNEEQITQRSFNEEAPKIVNANEPHMACLFLVDTSISMEGQPIEELNASLNQFKRQVCQDKLTRDILDVAIVEFNSIVNVVQPFVPVEYMEPVRLTADGGTNMTAGLRTAIDMIDDRYRFYKRTSGQPYCPWVVMITDGYPNDSIDSIAEEIAQLDSEDKMRLWSLAVQGANTDLLNKLGHGKRVLALRGYDFSKFFDWVNKSMRAISVSSPGERAKGQDLPDNVDKAVSDDWM